jgi:hypothetical protein
MLATLVTPFRQSVNYYSACLAGFVVGILVPSIAIFLILFGLPWYAATAVGISCGVLLFTLAVPRVPESWQQVIRERPWWVVALWTLACLAVVVMVARLAVFEVNPNLAGYSLLPSNPFMTTHNHVSGYMSAAIVAQHEPQNLYNPDRYESPQADSILPSVAPLDRDIYIYPPTYLILPWTMELFTHNFFALRAAWFACTAPGS